MVDIVGSYTNFDPHNTDLFVAFELERMYDRERYILVPLRGKYRVPRG